MHTSRSTWNFLRSKIIYLDLRKSISKVSTSYDYFLQVIYLKNLPLINLSSSCFPFLPNYNPYTLPLRDMFPSILQKKDWLPTHFECSIALEYKNLQLPNKKCSLGLGVVFIPWDRVSQCSPNGPGFAGLPVSASQGMGWQATKPSWGVAILNQGSL
jgi:hypothetical protein